MRSKNVNAHEKIGADRTEGCSGLLPGCLGLRLVVRGIDHIAMRGLQVADRRFALKRGITQTVRAHHAIEHRYENVQNENAVYDKTFEKS